MRFKAYLLTKLNADLELRDDIKITSAIPENHVIVRLLASGVCRSQLMEISGERSNAKFIPHLLGHEGIGEVCFNPHGIKNYKVGKKLILTWIRDRDKKIPQKIYSDSKNNFINCGSLTTFSEYTCIDVSQTLPLEEDHDYLKFATFGCAGLTGAGTVLNYLKDLNSKTSVAIVGLGGVGYWAAEALAWKKFSNVTCFETSINKINNFKKVFPNFNFILNKSIDFNISNKFEYVFESTGSTDGIEFAINLANDRFGKCFFVSHPGKNESIKINPYDLISGKQIIGVWGGGYTSEKNTFKLGNFINYVNEINKNRFETLFSFDQLNEAVKSFSAGSIVRPVINFD